MIGLGRTHMVISIDAFVARLYLLGVLYKSVAFYSLRWPNPKCSIPYRQENRVTAIGCPK